MVGDSVEIGKRLVQLGSALIDGGETAIATQLSILSGERCIIYLNLNGAITPVGEGVIDWEDGSLFLHIATIQAENVAVNPERSELKGRIDVRGFTPRINIRSNDAKRDSNDAENGKLL